MIKGGTSIGTGRVADIAAFGVENPQVVAGQYHQLCQCFDAGWSHGFEEGDIGLECSNDIVGSGDDVTTKRIDRGSTTAEMGGNAGRVGVKTHAQEAVVTLNVVCECVLKTHGYPFSLQLFIDDVLPKVI